MSGKQNPPLDDEEYVPFRVYCCEAGKHSEPDPCPWHGPPSEREKALYERLWSIVESLSETKQPEFVELVREYLTYQPTYDKLVMTMKTAQRWLRDSGNK